MDNSESDGLLQKTTMFNETLFTYRQKQVNNAEWKKQEKKTNHKENIVKYTHQPKGVVRYFP